MVGYALSPSARADIEGIWDYTVRHWGEAQAERYTRDIRDACEALGDGTLSGRSAETSGPDTARPPSARM